MGVPEYFIGKLGLARETLASPARKPRFLCYNEASLFSDRPTKRKLE